MRFFALFALLLTFAAPAAQAEDPRAVMESFLDDLKTLWVPLNNDPNASFDSRRRWTRNLVNTRFDFDYMTRSSMGTRWNRMTESQKSEYKGLFYDALVETAIDWFSAYDGQVFEITSIREAGKNTEIRTRFEYADGRNLNSTWVTRNTGGKYLFRDIRVAGLSLMADFRGKYKLTIDREGFDGFFEKLKRDTAKQRASQQ